MNRSHFGSSRLRLLAVAGGRGGLVARRGHLAQGARAAAVLGPSGLFSGGCPLGAVVLWGPQWPGRRSWNFGQAVSDLQAVYP